MKTFNQYNESIRDKMTPKTKEEMVKLFGDMTPDKKVANGYMYNILSLAKEGIKEGGNPKPFGNFLTNAISRGYIDIVKFMVDNNIEDIHEYESSKVLLAINSGNLELVNLLLNEYNCKVDVTMTECLSWVNKGYIDIVKLILLKIPKLKVKLKVKAEKLEKSTIEIRKCI